MAAGEASSSCLHLVSVYLPGGVCHLIYNEHSYVVSIQRAGLVWSPFVNMLLLSMSFQYLKHHQGSCEHSKYSSQGVLWLVRQGPRPCGLHAVVCWMKSWVPGPSEASSRGLGPVLDPSDLHPVRDTPHTRPPAQGVPILYARPVARPSRSSGGR